MLESSQNRLLAVMEGLAIKMFDNAGVGEEHINCSIGCCLEFVDDRIRSTRTRQGAPTADLCVVEWACRVNSVGAHGDDENDDNGEDGARRGELIAIISHLYFLSSFSPSLPDASVDSRTFQTPKYTKEGRAGS
nr:hypothetical transcript [Hymenolepis microstoma]